MKPAIVMAPLPYLAMLSLTVAAATPREQTMDYRIATVPAGYNLVLREDCGVRDRQPNVRCEGVHTFSPSDVPADESIRSVAWGWRKVSATFQGLKPDVPYVLAVTYANEPFNNRVQSLYADGVQLHGPHPLPRGGYERLLFRLPREVTSDGRLELEFRLEAEVNVVVSEIELWAPLPPPERLHIADVSALWKDLEGQVLDYAWRPVADVQVRVEGAPPATGSTRSGPDGRFHFPRSVLAGLDLNSGITFVARIGGISVRHEVPPSDLVFEPVRYRPMPEFVQGVRPCTISLDGLWKMRVGDPTESRRQPLSGPGWKAFRVPGQWLQQGLDVPVDQPVSVAHEFVVPASWVGHRVILRFDAVHAGTRYWINGQYLGYTEHLFTPVEWDITEHVHFGHENRLDMEMVVQTESERLAYASGYAFHNLGGIPRSVRLFALPQTHLRSLILRPGLSDGYHTGVLTVSAQVMGPQAATAVLRIKVAGVEHRLGVDASWSGTIPVPSVQPWTPETPRLYDVSLELLLGKHVCERIVRRLGFRNVEVRGSKLLVNGRPVKLAGACHHETHPLTGRADTARWAREDVRLLKDANLNYVRTSHYPPTQEFLDECDRLGLFVEVEAPFCWVGDETYGSLRTILTPTSAMVDYHHWHPSVIMWSLANESSFNRCFEVSNRLVKDLDPTRPTTFNNPDPKRICDIANVHYPRMPFDEYDPDDPRPLLLGEYFFPVCHEQTDVRRNPGLRLLWGAGHSDPESEYGKACAREFNWPYMQPGEPPGAWTHIVRSRRVIGGAIWALLDEPFYLPNGKRAGYAWIHGFWGLVDGWRRPKPEHWLARQIFSPVWFPVRRLPFEPGQRAVEVPVENRFAFTDLEALEFSVRCRGEQQVVRTKCAPGSAGVLRIVVPRGAGRGDEVVIEPRDASGRVIVTATLWLGSTVTRPPAEAGLRPVPSAGLRLRNLSSIEEMIVRGATALQGALDQGTAGIPFFHATRYDFGDLWPGREPFAVIPSKPVARTFTTSPSQGGVVATLSEHSSEFDGTVTVRPGTDGTSVITFDVEWKAPDFYAREIGLRIPLNGHDWTLEWERWSEWGEASDEPLLARHGTTRPFRGKKASRMPESAPPRWPWALDETEEGTAAFRSAKFHILRAAIRGPKGEITVFGRADVHVRAAVENHGTALYLLTHCGHGPRLVQKGERLRGEFVASFRLLEERRGSRR